MKVSGKFVKFLENLKGTSHDKLIENVELGFKACFEEGYMDMMPDSGVDIDPESGKGIPRNPEVREHMPPKVRKALDSISFPIGKIIMGGPKNPENPSIDEYRYTIFSAFKANHFGADDMKVLLNAGLVAWGTYHGGLWIAFND